MQIGGRMPENIFLVFFGIHVLVRQPPKKIERHLQLVWQNSTCSISCGLLIWSFLKWGYPKIIHFHRIFHNYNPSSYWGTPMTMEPPIYKNECFHCESSLPGDVPFQRGNWNRNWGATTFRGRVATQQVPQCLSPSDSRAFIFWCNICHQRTSM